jgi:hypothetical protein
VPGNRRAADAERFRDAALGHQGVGLDQSKYLSFAFGHQ